MTTIEIRIQNMYDTLSNAEKRVADYILHNLDHIFSHPLSTLAKLSGTSQGAWVRFCKSMGYDGMKSFKNALFIEMKETATENSTLPDYEFIDVKSHTSLTSMAQNICASSILAIENTLQLFEEKKLQCATDKIICAKRIALFGINASGAVADDFYRKLLRIRYPAVFNPDFHVSLTIASTLRKQDVALFFSYTGETPDSLRLMELAKKQGAYIIAVTSPTENHMAQSADLSLYVTSPQTDKRSGAMSARISQLVMTDILYTAILNQDYNRSERFLEDTYQACRGQNL